MNFPIFASFIVFVIWLTYELSKHRNLDEKTWKKYWEKESVANSTRRKPLDTLDYVIIPMDSLPIHTLTEDDTIAECLSVLVSLQENPIVNLTGISNTDLKLMYGAPNINLLTLYDQNYTRLARTLQKWADRLYTLSYTGDAKKVLEFAISTNTDIWGSYVLLSKIYQKEGTPEKIATLLKTAEGLNSAMKPSIVRTLKEFDPNNG